MKEHAGGNQQGAAARRRYNRWSGIYPWLSTAGEQALQQEGFRQLTVRPGETILDVGCGTGAAMLQMGERFPEATCIGVDISEGMLQAARRSARRAQQPLKVVQGDLVHLPVQTDVVDAAFMSFVLELLPEERISLALREVGRTLKPGGRLVVVSMGLVTPKTWLLRLYEWLHFHLPDWVDCRPIHTETWLVNGGFRIEAITRKGIFGLPVDIIVAQVG